MADKRKFNGIIGRTINDTKFSYATVKSPSDGKPNVIYIVLDDTGFAQLGCYGSTIHTSNIDRLANEGLRYNNFHTTAICSATRASLLTGANHHSVGISTVAETNFSTRNNLGGINPEYGTIAEVLHEYDYHTIAIGKWHLSANDERSGAGPYHNWPLNKGFDNYYGFLAADMDQWNPTLTRDNTMVEAPKKASEGYHLSEDLTENAIHYIYEHHFSYPKQPFFLYLAYGAMHSPHHAPQEYIDKYKGKFDKGWDAIREEWFANQKRLGVIPQEAELTERNEHVKAWDDLTDNQKKAYARYMEVFAGFLEHTDAQIGKLVDFLREQEILDNTIIVLLSDNGASAEGGKDGHFNLNTSMDILEEYPRDVELALQNYDTLGNEFSQPHYPTGWANAGNTPFQWYKQWTYEGGVKDSMIVRYPEAIRQPGSVVSQFVHVSDITPTILDVLGFEKPKNIKGVAQEPLQGISFKKTFEDKDARTDKTVQYFEMHGNRAIYKDGWKAVVNHTFNDSFGINYADDVWELYHVDEDYSEKHDVAKKYPEKLEELKEEWLIQAGRYGVFPMLKTGMLHSHDAIKEVHGRMALPAKTYVYKNVRYPYNLVSDPGLGTRTHSVIITLNRTDTAEEGALLAKGDRFGGLSLYIKDNKPKFVYNLDADTFYIAESDAELPLGEVKVRLDFVVVGEHQAEAGLYVNDKKVGATKVEQFFYTVGAGTLTSLKQNKFTSVYDNDYASPFEYKGEVKEVIIDVAATTVDAEEDLNKALHVE
ncbi:MAG: arylsulfatase [Roseburia sp.]|nr:arylsulfatase [Roseburia sp.]